jgi:hypothetical protein
MEGKYMSSVSEIKEKIEEVKRLKAIQQLQADRQRWVWEQEIIKVQNIENTIYDLKQELREAKQAAFDEDGMLVATNAA